MFKKLSLLTIFCTFICANHYIDMNYKKTYTNIDKKNMLCLLWKIFHKSQTMVTFGNNVPNKYDMIHYGGYKNIKDFKLELKTLEDQSTSLSLNRCAPS